MSDAAPTIAPIAERLLGGPLPVRLRAWDGSEAGPPDAPRVLLTSPRAVRRLLWQPGELGLAEAYISGDLDVEGDLTDGLRAVRHALRERSGTATPPRATLATRARAAARAARLGVIGPPPRAAGHHHAFPSEFYERLLDPSMAYSCAYWTSHDPSYGLADAQRDKLEVICRKLALVPGARLLDIGCGWGALALYAADRHKAQVTAVTSVPEERDFVRERVDELGLGQFVEVVLSDHRDLDGGMYEAVACVETGERVGHDQYPYLARTLHGMLRPGGRALVQQMSRAPGTPGGAFIETYVAPGLHTRPLGETIGLLEAAGLEVRSSESLREHYVRTVGAWREALETQWDAFRLLAGEHTARRWRLHLAGGALAFEERRMGVDQILAVRPTARGVSGMPDTPADWYPAPALEAV
ncbi:cyclopropane-fatty-acyl-phospholipid synthase family protein [Streptomyces sp. NPDC019937]|uniref:cyclopropane-fatty-acyl-phospholipid synthase family protein n=1 Tax=Streptomyces sp. NPDC019937 TaxID=3154787 RepID=UPI00340569F2